MKYYRELVEIILLGINIICIGVNIIFKNWFGLSISVVTVFILVDALIGDASN